MKFYYNLDAKHLVRKILLVMILHLPLLSFAQEAPAHANLSVDIVNQPGNEMDSSFLKEWLDPETNSKVLIKNYTFKIPGEIDEEIAAEIQAYFENRKAFYGCTVNEHTGTVNLLIDHRLSVHEMDRFVLLIVSDIYYKHHHTCIGHGSSVKHTEHTKHDH